ncbi:hypothetical protein ACTA71_009357 [Dictyostelium dimigraforme]
MKIYKLQHHQYNHNNKQLKTTTTTTASISSPPEVYQKELESTITFLQYYKKLYPKYRITDLNQPLLKSEVKLELTFLTGLTDESIPINNTASLKNIKWVFIVYQFEFNKGDCQNNLNLFIKETQLQNPVVHHPVLPRNFRDIKLSIYTDIIEDYAKKGYSFFLIIIPQNNTEVYKGFETKSLVQLKVLTQCSINPTHYHVLLDEYQMACQFAQKMAFIIGRAVGRNVDPGFYFQNLSSFTSKRHQITDLQLQKQQHMMTATSHNNCNSMQQQQQQQHIRTISTTATAYNDNTITTSTTFNSGIINSNSDYNGKSTAKATLASLVPNNSCVVTLLTIKMIIVSTTKNFFQDNFSKDEQPYSCGW